ncbi:MAG: CaiB/BaiF CoA transferase family protein [Gammaproteobacteria bacterium]
MMKKGSLPLRGTRVIELSHMVMGPSAGLVLADLGATVIKIEPPGGDKTRLLKGSGAGYFTMYNRNKHSVCVDLKSTEGRDIVLDLIKEADVLVENFRNGTMDKLGLGYAAASALNPRLIYCSARGFLRGPYEHRTALDEVTQMMGGLAYMTGPPGQPLRAGASVVDVMGGMFGVIGILAALEQRHSTGKGQHLSSSLYESTAFLVGQHMAQMAVLGEPAQPMPTRISAWAVYDIFKSSEGESVFVAVVSDGQWQTFCKTFDLGDIGSDPALATNAARVAARDRIIPRVSEVLQQHSKDELMRALDDCGLPYAPIARPQDLFDDPHLVESGGLLPVTTVNGNPTHLPALPVEMNGDRLGVRKDVPTPGQDTDTVLREMGLSAEDIARLREQNIVS